MVGMGKLMFMKRFLLFSALAAAIALPVARADDSVRSAQTILQSQGYYTGPVDGELNADTKAALRRYQIRNQLEPSGALTAETVAALNKEEQAAPANTPPPQPAPTVPPPPSTQVGPTPGPVPVNRAYAALFARTPYENAAPEIQANTVRNAQAALAKRGLFRGVADGRPGPETEEALLRFQSARELPRTGRLDIDTLAELHLLPVNKLRPQRGEPYVPRVPAGPNGAVRGIPLD